MKVSLKEVDATEVDEVADHHEVNNHKLSLSIILEEEALNEAIDETSKALNEEKSSNEGRTRADEIIW